MRTANILILLLHTTCAFLNAPQIALRTAVATNSGVTLHRPLPSIKRAAQPPRAIAITPSPLSPAIPQLQNIALLQPALVPIVSIIGLCLLGMAASLPRALFSESERKKLHRRVFTGFFLGVAVSLWIFSGTWFFLSIFAMFAVIAQNEYYDMARENGCYPTWKLGLLGSVGMYVAACSTNPILRDALFPLTGTVTVVYLLLRQEPKTPPTTMNDISSTFVSAGRRRIHTHRKRTTSTLTPCLSLLLASLSDGHLLLRLHALLLDPLALPRPVNNAHTTARGPPRRFTRLRLADHTEVIGLVCRLVYLGCLSPMVDDVLDRHSGRYAHSHRQHSLSTRLTRFPLLLMMLRTVFAYFAGKNFGKTPLIAVSPRKTWEGFWGGCLGAMAAFSWGATLMRWPRPLLSGAFYGLMCAVMALIGDLTVSLLKRSAGVKDTGSILPGHGGLLDRLDSYLLVSAPSYFFVMWLLRRGMAL